MCSTFSGAHLPWYDLTDLTWKQEAEILTLGVLQKKINLFRIIFPIMAFSQYTSLSFENEQIYYG
jgi:hypothetical protein